jgi:putative oxygen-independent coproporphyrinogen III oxidase
MQEGLIVYVHVPFCSSKCHFCYWTSPVPTSELVRNDKHSADYAIAVVRQVRELRPQFKGSPAMRLIYFGGGTPSLMEARDLAAILDAVHQEFPKHTEFGDTTLEVAPETVHLEKLRDLRAAGFNRLSFGFQSLNASRVRHIGRAHSADEAINAFQMARKAGFSNLNIDLILGFPDETDEEWRETLDKALELSPDHLSIYVYKVVPGTVMARQLERGESQPTPHPVAVRRYLEARDRITSLGYQEYMFQMFAREDKRCFCDQDYFTQDCDFVGFGAGGHSLLGGHLMGHSPNLSSYLQQPGFDFRYPIANSADAIHYKLIEMLHTDGGIDPVRFQRRFRLSLSDARQRHPQVEAFLAILEAGDLAPGSNGGWRFRDSRERARWLSTQPQRVETSSTTAEASNVVQIAAVS